MDLISAATAASYRRKIAAFNRWLGKRRSYRTEEVPPHLRDVTNEMRNAVEVYEFVHHPPTKYFAYVHLGSMDASWGSSGFGTTRGATLTTFMGSILGHGRVGEAYRALGNSRRRSISIRAINGYEYHGTYYESSGDYARVKRGKRWHA